MKIPFPQSITGLDVAPRLKEYLLNLFITDSGVVRTPGIESHGAGLGACRGAVRWRDGYCYQVSGNSLIRVLENGSIKSLGTIAGNADCVFSEGQVNLVVIVKGGKGYYYNDTNGLQEITDSDFVPSVSVDFIDGRHVFIPYDGEPAFYTEIDNPSSISPLAFFDAEELPDKNKAVINIKNQLIVLGDKSAETFRTNINPDVVYTRRQGSRIDVGYIGGLTRYNEGCAFLGWKRDQGPRFYVMMPGQYKAFSTPAIDEILSADFTQAELEACESERFEWLGYEALVFTIKDRTFCFIADQWIYLSSDITNSTTGKWTAKGVCHAYGRYIVGSRDNLNIGKLSPVNSEYGEDLEFEVSTFIRDKKNSFFSLSRIELDNLSGQSEVADTISLSVSKDGYTYGPFIPQSLGEIGQYQKQIGWQPIGVFESFCGFKLRSTANVKFGLESIEAL